MGAGLGIAGHTSTYDVSNIAFAGTPPVETNVILVHDNTNFDRVEIRFNTDANSGHGGGTLTIKLQYSYDLANDGSEVWTDMTTLDTITTGASTTEYQEQRDAVPFGIKHRLNCVVSVAEPTTGWTGTITAVYAT